jgi:hypothetical protein
VEGKRKVTSLSEGSRGPYIGYVVEGAYSQFQSKPGTGEDVALLP